MKKSKLCSYSFTYRKNASKDCFPCRPDYDCCLDLLSTKGEVKHCVFEEDSRGKLHIHGVLEAPKGLKYKECTIKGYASNFKEIWNLESWLDYIEKNVDLAKRVNRATWWIQMHHDENPRLKSPDYSQNLMLSAKKSEQI